jgi:hypothetical protein
VKAPGNGGFFVAILFGNENLLTFSYPANPHCSLHKAG